MDSEKTGWRLEDVETVHLVALGLANKEIAARRGVSETAIKKRLGRLMRRMGVQNRTALVRVALTEGMVPRDED